MPRETFPAGVRTSVDIRIPLIGVLDTAGAVSILVSSVLSFKAELEKVTFFPDVTGAGAGATQAIRVRKGAAAGAIIATVTPTLAAAVLGGPGIAANVAAADAEAAKFKDGDTFSITKDAGTVFTAGGGTLSLQFWQRPQSRR